MNLLNDCSEEEQDKAMDPNRKRSTSNLSALRNCTVQAMSNLLNANIDSGLMHSIGEIDKCHVGNKLNGRKEGIKRKHFIISP